MHKNMLQMFEMYGIFGKIYKYFSLLLDIMHIFVQ